MVVNDLIDNGQHVGFAVVGSPGRLQRSLESPALAFAFGAPIALLGGLIGLGGAEFRLPVLVGPLGYAARKAVPLNLAISLVTIAASLAIRSQTPSLASVAPYALAVGALIAGAMIAAFAGTAVFNRLSDAQLERAILVLLTGIGAALIAEAFLPGEAPALLPATFPAWLLAGVLFGLGIGFVSSLLGVAGGEVIIPTLVFAYGLDIKTAGTASLLISLPVVVVGIARYASRGAYAHAELTRTVGPMGLGSVIGAVLGGLMVGAVPANALKIGLGIILLYSSWRTFRRA